MTKKSKVVCAFAFGCVFVSVLLCLAWFVPNPTPFQYQTFRIVMALATAGVAAMIPGLLKIDFHPSVDVMIRAGGALAVFVIVYFFNPAKLSGHSPITESIVNSPGGMLAGRDVNVYSTGFSPQSVLTSIAFEFRMTCTLKERAEISPGEVRYVPVGGGVSYFRGPSGSVPMKFESPVRFSLQRR